MKMTTMRVQKSTKKKILRDKLDLNAKSCDEVIQKYHNLIKKFKLQQELKDL